MGLKRLLPLVVLAIAGSIVLVPGASAGNFDEARMGCAGEDPATCASGMTGQPYTLTVRLQDDEDTGCAVLSVASGNLPLGLSITQQFNETKYAVISGTPTQAGTYEFYLNVTYNSQPSCPFKNPSDDRFRITINQGLAKLTLGPESASTGTVGAVYSLQMTATVPEPKTWSIRSGTLPPGLSIDPSTGLISGTPTTAGSYTFEVLAKMVSDSRSDTKVLGIAIRDRLAITAADPFTPARRAQGEVSVPFEASLTATGGEGTYTWSLAGGSLPPGLSLTNGVITGTPNTAGDYRFAVQVTDGESRLASYAARISVASKLAITSTILKPAKVGRLYSTRLTTAGGVKPVSWKLKGTKPPKGILLDRTSGRLLGIPTKPGVYRLVVEARDALGVTGTKTVRLVVAP